MAVETATEASTATEEQPTERVAALQALLQERGLAAYIVPTADAHNSEYVAASDMRRVFISGFTGSAGTAVVLASPDATGRSAYVWVDSRYWVQVEAERQSGWGVVKQGSGEELDLPIDAFLKQALPAGSAVGVDPLTATYVLGGQWAASLEEADLVLSPVSDNLVDAVWADARPPLPSGEIAVQPLEVAGAAASEKLDTVRERLTEAGANATVVTALDEIMWLFNIRGNPADIDFNPVIMSYAVVTVDPPTATLWVEPDKMDDAAFTHLTALAELRPYDGAVPDLAGLLGEKAAQGGDANDEEACVRVLLDKISCNLAIHTLLSQAEGVDVIEEKSVVLLPKALKSAAEIAGYYTSHLRDGSALTAFFCWLEHHVVELEETHHTEYSVGLHLHDCRAALDGFVDDSFGCIAGYNSNGALPHYAAHDDGSALEIHKEGMFLLDSGGQYVDGTTDTTRTMYLGHEPTEHQRRMFTRVLQGHIDLAAATFPAGTTGQQLDMLARVPLWREGLEYHHGTGHGVGSFLNVHESGSIYGFAPRAAPDMLALQPTMVITNEPGYYEEGNFGVRHENVYLVRPLFCGP
jgi:Xaa-Pro aminopeptidase